MCIFLFSFQLTAVYFSFIVHKKRASHKLLFSLPGELTIALKNSIMKRAPRYSMANITFHQKLTFHARHSLEEAAHLARFTKHTSVNIEHLLLALFLEKGSLASILLRGMGFTNDPLAEVCLKKSSISPGSADPSFSPEVKDVLRRAYSLASEFRYPYVGTEHLICSLMEAESETVDTIIDSLGIEDKKIESTLAAHMNFDHFPSLGKIFENPDTPPSGKKDTGSETPFLDQFSVNLHNQKEASAPFIGREAEIDRLVQTLSRKNKNNPLLVGDPGVGKTALVSALAQRITRAQVPYHLLHKKILSLDLPLLVAGTNFRGEFENRLKEVVREVSEHPEIILFIDEIHTLIGAGNTQGGLDAANILKPALARGEIRCIGATTLSEYKKHFEKDAALERRFQQIEVVEPEPEEAKKILSGVRTDYEAFHGVSVSQEILARAVDLSVQFLPERFLPDKALDILDESLALAKHSLPLSEELITKGTLEGELRRTREKKEMCIKEERYDEAAFLHDKEQSLEKEITFLAAHQKGAFKTKDLPALKKLHLDTVVARMTRIPLSVIASDSPLERVDALGQALGKELLGQKEATQELLATLTQSALGLRRHSGPFASFLLLGPTGTGKTLTAKLLAKHFFGSQKNLIRLDMSEFSERHSIAQMIGAPAGYVGYGEGGKLTEAVRRKPYSLILFDEIDKAHPDVWNVLLQILDEGTLTDAEGRVVDFSHTIIILTSNHGGEAFSKNTRIGFAAKKDASWHEEQKITILKTVQKILRPELFARMGSVLVYTPLDTKTLTALTRLEIKKIQKTFLGRSIRVHLTPAVTKHLVASLTDTHLGARALQKHIRETLEREIVHFLIQNPLAKLVYVDIDSKSKLLCSLSSSKK
jgi:ATP-dependent Clp protease ATP-binding subunit ClpC